MKIHSNFHSAMTAAFVSALSLSSCLPSPEADITTSSAKSANRLPSSEEGSPNLPTIEIPAPLTGSGIVMLPTFKSAREIYAAAVGIQDPVSVRAAMAIGLGENLPYVGTLSDVNEGAVFSLTKLAIAACNDRIILDADTRPAVTKMSGLLNLAGAYNDPANTAENWDKFYANVAERFWNRTTVTAQEKALLDTLRNETAANAAPAAATRTAALAICAAMGISIDAITY